jgi:predicted extracellular nuclease
LGNLDHALANESALAKTIDVTEWHINADEPIALDYNTRFKSDTQIISFYAADAYRSSDHDPVLVSLQLDAPVESRSSGGSLSIFLLGLLAMIGIRRKK